MTLVYCIHGSEWYAASVGYIQVLCVKGCHCRPKPIPPMTNPTWNICDEDRNYNPLEHNEDFQPATATSPRFHWHGKTEQDGGQIR